MWVLCGNGLVWDFNIWVFVEGNVEFMIGGCKLKVSILLRCRCLGVSVIIVLNVNF